MKLEEIRRKKKERNNVTVKLAVKDADVLIVISVVSLAALYDVVEIEEDIDLLVSSLDMFGSRSPHLLPITRKRWCSP